MEDYDFDINFIESKDEILKKWLKNLPSSMKNKVKNILSIDSENPQLDLEVCNCFKQCNKYYIVQSDYLCYKNSINKLFGKFNFKISYSEIFDYELDPYISYDLIIFFTNFNLDEDITSFIKQAFKFLSHDGKIMIITCSNDKFVMETREKFNLKFISDREFRENLDLKCRFWYTHVKTYLNLNKLSKKEILKLTNKELSDEQIQDFKEYALNKYDDYVSVPISVIILSKIKMLTF